MQNKSKVILFIFFLGYGIEAFYAQGQGNIWYFGDHAGLDFNTNPPTPLLDGQVNTSEGCASIADPFGNLLFYTDGIKVWDRLHNQMPNGFGLLGDPSSAQSGVIIPMPGNDSIYYLFTTPDYLSSSIGFRYTLVNMNLNGGLGDIAPANKNILLFSPSSEKLAASFHCNKKDIWVVGRSNQNFYSYLITATGISATPTITSGITSSSYPYPYGMKSSPNGKKIAANYFTANLTELYDFDIITGLLSNPVILSHASYDYGSEFSPDGTKLYISLISTKEIYQYDLTATNINASAILVGTVGGSNAGMPQLGSDGKVYVAEYNSGAVAIINNPNALGLACNLQPGALNLGGGISKFGFPTMISSFFSPPVKIIALDTTCFSSLLNFSLINVSDEDSVHWTFDDPSTGVFNNDTGLSVNHMYSASGNFNVQAIVYYPCHADTMHDNIYIAPLPAAIFSSANSCEPAPVIFYDTSYISSGSLTWSWDFGDGSTNSNIPSPSHNYNAVGNYPVTLIVTSEAGCKDTMSQIANVNPLPVANLNGNNACLNKLTTFSDLSIANNTLIAWNWNFGDGDSSALQNTSHTYANFGSYSVSLTIINNFGCKDTNTTTVIVHPLPSSNFSSIPECFHDSTCFSDLSSIPSGNITGWSWNFSDAPSGINNNSPLQNPCHVFSSFGLYNAILTVTSDSSCQSAVQLPVIVYQLPLAGFTSSNSCFNIPSVFTDASTLIGGIDTIINWNWNFADGSITSNVESPSHNYIAPGNYPVVLIVTTNNGCKDTVNHTVIIYSNPVVDFNYPDSGCAPVCTQFVDLSQTLSGNITNWDWGFSGGNPSQSTSSNPSVCWDNPGIYDVHLIVTTNYSCKDTLVMSNYINVFSLPDADFCVTTSQNSINTPYVSFCDLWSPDVVSWVWDFGDNSSFDTISRSPSHDYSAKVSNNEFYSNNVCLYVQNNHGCIDSICKIVEFFPEFSFFMPNALTPNDDNNNDLFFGKGIGVKEYNISLFDRFGNLVWSCSCQGKNTDWDNMGQDGMPSACKWDGSLQRNKNTETVQRDVYVWKVKLTDIFDKIHNYIGNVTVVK